MMAGFLVVGVTSRPWFDMDNHFGQTGNFMKEAVTNLGCHVTLATLVSFALVLMIA